MKTHITLTTLNPVIRFRQRWGFSQQQIAKHLQISRSMAGMLEQGRREITPGLISRLLELDMKLAAESQDLPGPACYPEVQQVLTGLKLKREKLEIKEQELRNRAMKLNDQLTNMIRQHRETLEWLSQISSHMKDAGHNQLLVQRWKKHELAASRKLLTCNDAAQSRVRRNMETLLAEAALYQSKHEELAGQMEGIEGCISVGISTLGTGVEEL